MSSVKPIEYRFKQSDRASNPDAPDYDPTRLVKSWVDPNPGPGPAVLYQMLDPQGSVVTKPMTVNEASTYNFPGHKDYPVFKQTRSAATFHGGSPIPFGVILKSEAQSLAKDMGLDDSAVFDELDAFESFGGVDWPANDPRRAYGIKFANGASEEAAVLQAARNVNGIGAPGEWVKDANGTPSWKSELPSDIPTTQVMGVPIVPLAANEHIVSGPFGLVVVVDDAAPASSSGSVDLSTDPTAQEILAGVKALRGVFHV